MAKRSLLVYGAYGFTGRIVLEHLRRRGLDFVVAGRDEARARAAAAAFGVAHRVFSLDDARAIDRGLAGARVLLNAAGPFSSTAKPLLDACLRKRVHYLDVCGELAPLEHAASLDDAAKKRGVMLLPGVGFDVVPSDCLAVHLARRLPGATALSLGIAGMNLVSRGSAATFAEHAGTPVYVRKEGRLEPILFRTQMRWVDFGDGTRPVVAVTWGDLATAFRSTGIPNIEVYFESTLPRLLGVATNQLYGFMLRSEVAKSWLRRAAATLAEGPSAERRAAERVTLVGEATRNGRSVRSRLVTPEAYTFTGMTAAAVVERVFAGAVEPGFRTPGQLFGPDFVLSLGGVVREELS